MKYIFTSESVTEGHPDKVCDRISDSILDELLTQDPMSRVACETVASTGLVLVTGEITSNANVDYSSVVRDAIKQIGYTEASLGFSADACSVIIAINKQSQDISQSVSSSLEHKQGEAEDIFDSVGAGDQGLMFGFACDETPELMPLPISMAHRLALKLSQVRKDETVKYLRPDGKTQVSIEYEDGIPQRIDTILISTQHDDDISLQRIHSDLIKHVITPVVKDYSLDIDNQTKIIINPSGRFVIGGPHGDAGLTGRKIIVDTYGGYARHGGGAFSGKDATKVDRSAAYMARYVAKNIVAAKLAKRCEVQIAYAIGMAKPVSVSVFTDGTGVISDEQLGELVKETFDFRPLAIITNFDLRNLPAKNNGSFYRELSAYGHLGRTDIKTPWEELDKVELLRKKYSEANCKLERV